MLIFQVSGKVKHQQAQNALTHLKYKVQSNLKWIYIC